MQEDKDNKQESLEDRLKSLVIQLHQTCGHVPVTSLESLCRKINIIRLKLYSFKGGIYGKK